jgi:integrase
MTGKRYRTHTTIIGQHVMSPRFEKKCDVNEWLRIVKEARKNILVGKELTAQQRQILSHAGFEFQIYEGDLFVNDLAARFLKARAKDYVASTALPNFDHLRKYILPEMGHRNVYGIGPSEIRRFLNGLTLKKRIGKDDLGNPKYEDTGQKMAEGTVSRIKVTLSLLFGYAIEEGLVRDSFLNPVQKTSRKRGSRKAKPEDNIKVFETEDEISDFLTAARDEGPLFYAFAMTGINTGARKSELLGLTWASVDFDGDRIVISQMLEQNSLEIVARTKAGEGKSRIVPLNDPLKECLLEWRGLTFRPEKKDFVFPRKNGRPFAPREINYHFTSACAAASVKNIGPHGMRHTYATHYILNGGSIESLRDLLGHESVTTTELYLKLVKKLRQSKDRTVSFKVKAGGANVQ